MPARQSAAMDRAIKRVLRGATIATAARKGGVNYVSLWRALRRHGITAAQQSKEP